MINTICFLEFRSQLEMLFPFFSSTQTAQDNALVISLEPSIRTLLKQQGIDADSTLSYFSNAEHASLLRESEQVSKLIREDLEFDVGDDYSELYCQEFGIFFMHLWMQARKTIEILNSAHVAHPTARFAIPLNGDSDSGFLHTLGPKYCSAHGIDFAPITQTETERSLQSVGISKANPSVQNAKGLTSFDRIITLLYGVSMRQIAHSPSILTPLQFVGLNHVTKSLHQRFPRLRFIVLRHGEYRRRAELRRAILAPLNAVLAPWLRANASPVTIPVDIVSKGLGIHIDDSLHSVFAVQLQQWLERNRTNLEYRGVNLGDALFSEATRLTIARLVTLHWHCRVQEELISRIRPSLVVAPFVWGVARPTGAIASKQGIPAMVIPSKTLTMHDGDDLARIGEQQIGQEIVSEDYAYVAVQTPLLQRYLQNTGYCGQQILTGPLIWSKIEARDQVEQRRQFMEKCGVDGRIIVYAPSARRIPYFHVVESMDEVLSSMADIVQVVSELSGVFLVLRLHPDHYITRNVVETLISLPSNVMVNDAERASFKDVLALADVLVSNVSTTTEEALQNRIPVVLYDKWKRYNHLAAPTVQHGLAIEPAPAYYVHSKQDLNRVLRYMLALDTSALTVSEDLCSRYRFIEMYDDKFLDFVDQAIEESSEERGKRHFQTSHLR